MCTTVLYPKTLEIQRVQARNPAHHENVQPGEREKNKNSFSLFAEGLSSSSCSHYSYSPALYCQPWISLRSGMTHVEKTCSMPTSRCCQDTQQVISLGIGFWYLSKMAVASCMDLMKHSSTKELSEGMHGWTAYSVSDTPWIQTPWTFKRGRSIFWLSFDCWTSRWRGTDHLLWSIPSWDEFNEWSETHGPKWIRNSWIRIDQRLNGSESIKYSMDQNGSEWIINSMDHSGIRLDQNGWRNSSGQNASGGPRSLREVPSHPQVGSAPGPQRNVLKIKLSDFKTVLVQRTCSKKSQVVCFQPCSKLFELTWRNSSNCLSAATKSRWHLYSRAVSYLDWASSAQITGNHWYPAKLGTLSNGPNC